MATNDENLAEVSEIMRRFNELANEIQNEGKDANKVSAGLMLASCNYSTFLAAGNDGYLKQVGIDKLVAGYRKNLSNFQVIRKQKYNPDGED